MSKQSTPVTYNQEQHLALVGLNGAPVNALSKALRIGIIDSVKKALSDDKVKAIVLYSHLPLFSAGADISEFSGGDLSPMLPEVLDVIEQSTKPVIAIVGGNAFGGGLELALACHYRITHAKNKVGLPEVHLGILPGAGGTQRLPRLTDPKTALDMIVSGAPTPVTTLSGVFDLIVDSADELQAAAMAFATDVVEQQMPVKKVCDIELSMTSDIEALFEQYAQGVAAKTKGYFAPGHCVLAVKAAFTHDFKDGLARESELFMECMKTSQARAQQHFFFAERAASHVQGIAKDVVARDIKQVAVIGAGTMGGGIAMNFANAGIPVVMLELKQDALDKGLALIRRNYENSAKKGKLTTEQVEQRMSLLTGTTSYEDLSNVDLVIEAVFEKMSVKKEVFGMLDKVCKPGAILASNTSTLDLNEIAASVSRPQDVIGLHFFSPANVMKLLEIVRGEKTADDVIKTAMKLAKTIRKVGVLVGVCFGFVGNRMIEPYGREANRLMLEGATPEQVDKVIGKFGLPMGPFTMGDMAGLDIGYFVRESRREFIKHDPSYCIVADKLVAQGRVGLKVGKGAYLYEQGSRQPIPDPEVIEIAKQEAKRLGIQQREISDQEILERCIYPLINEGADILKEGIASKSSDIDVIYVYGYGFPVFRGGPMQYADEIGLAEVRDRLNHYKETLGEYGQHWFTPSSLLNDLADAGKTFGSLK
ncbi:3-hydroxyacyl-CoA dehydrogenase NAD-binding domain-containing protein [Brumicola nitratireducens]|uniref:3-hydroxyacyl-CoA dehydrogenase, NAD-binding protein n=1 Tax=Glaciecola nitratireducens (strain JCM 12485 / KCTC 12276 / FR1064) TaxID=1085623 RepID=G4QGP2_GLANF|nr:3-hydroxyacyl-CoA dehydrogenase NAD-binding domain-containing protein [Glaciecola nitratireducens]AEP29679.1 3-hydroxyacyl-CoA dehydrogenase, NAD-binding protein [Glaciecola nitratireducens FR1064]